MTIMHSSRRHSSQKVRLTNSSLIPPLALADKFTASLQTLFVDLPPVPQDDGPFPICSIQYSPSFVTVMNYFRAVLAIGEMSERALALTAAVIDGNPANYTAWYHRRKCLVALSKSLDDEIVYTNEVGGDNPKNYQIWFHRRACLDQLGGSAEHAREELKYVQRVIEDDSKNYHAWSHRQYIVSTYNLWSGEVEFVNKILDADIRNNSAWNQRWFAYHSSTTSLTYDSSTALSEVVYALDKASVDLYNESPFVYMVGVLREQWKINGDEKNATKVVVDKLSPLLSQKSQHIHSTLLEIYIHLRETDKAVKLCEELMTEVDQVRVKYWTWKMTTIPRA